MQLIQNWPTVLLKSWAVRLTLLSLICLAGFFFTSAKPEVINLPPKVFAAFAALFQFLAPIARVLAQKELVTLFDKFRKEELGAVTRRGLISAALVTALATPFIAQWEGVRLTAYKDIVGVPTICFGDTHGVQMGDRATMAECEDRLAEDVLAFYREISACMTNPNIPTGVQASLLELAFNVGGGKVCRSTMMRMANAGQYRAACEELHRWVRAGGKRIKGLENRRADSKRKLCLRGLT